MMHTLPAWRGKNQNQAAAAFLPTSLPKLELWLRADSLSLNDGDAVGTWLDNSGHGRDASQAVGSSQPIFHTGPKRLTFDGVDDGLTVASLPLPPEYTFAVVMNVAGNFVFGHGTYNSSDGTLMQNSNNISVQLRRAAGNYNYDSDNHWAGTGAIAAGLFTTDNANGYFYKNNTLIRSDTQSAAPETIATQPFYIMNLNGTFFFFAGDVHEVIVYSELKSPTDIGRLFNYLIAKWGIV